MKKGILYIIILIIIGVLSYFTYQNFNRDDNANDDNISENKTNQESKVARLTIVGDFLYEQPYYSALENGDDPELYFNRVKKYFQSDDLSIGNMEVVIGNDSIPVSGTGYSFCAPSSVGSSIIDLGMDVLSTANNHANDRGSEGRDSTIDFFKNNSDILTVGTYKDGEKDVTKNIKTVNGIKFGFLAYTTGTNVKIPKDERENIGLSRDPDGIDNEEYENKIKEEIELLKDKVDVIMVIMHWGVEFTYKPNEQQTLLAQKLNDWGVDIIVGSHSHSIQPIEWIKGESKDTLVYYSMGNFVSADDDISRTGETFDNAYQFGLLSTLEVKKENEKIVIRNVKTEPIVNYYDSYLRNFELIPFSEYTEEKAKTHYRYKYNFNRDFVKNTYETVIASEFR